MRQVLPNPWIPESVYRAAQVLDATVTYANSVPPTANAAIYIPVTFPVSAYLTGLTFRPSNATGNYDLGLYKSDLTRIASKGSTAMADALQTLTLDYLVEAGDTLFAALVFSSTSGALASFAPGLLRSVIAAGCAQEASALPLPTTPTFALPTTWVNLPVIAFESRR